MTSAMRRAMDDNNRRKSGRLVCAGLISSLGEVPDLSAGGCRIVCSHWIPLLMGSEHQITLEGDESTVVVTAKIVRRIRRGLRSFEYGMEFVNITDNQRAHIGNLSRTVSVKRLMPTMDEAANRAA